MSDSTSDSSISHSYRFALVVALAVFAVTQVPFWLGERWAPAGAHFDGLVGMVDDQNMYFSFIRQAAEGHWLFVNRLTHVDHRPALVNIEWLAVGWLLKALGGSQAWAYGIWRAVGVLLLVLGFATLAARMLRDRTQQWIALLLCAFGGGFGWVFLALERATSAATHPQLTLDLSEAIHPFVHMFSNPHLSVSHGLSLFFLAAFIAGEQTGRPRWYAVAAAIALFHGLIRPYDLILIYGILPGYVLVERVVTGAWTWRTTLLRLLPLAATAPLLAYYAALFHLHPIFKYWSSQVELLTPGIAAHALSFGAAGILCAARLLLARRFPLRPVDRLLLVWIAGVLFLIHGKDLPGLGFLPFAPVFGMTLPSAMLLLGAAVIDPKWFCRSDCAAISVPRVALAGGVVTLCCLSSAACLLKVCHNLRSFPDHYIPAEEYAAYEWLGQNARSSDVVCSTLASGNRMAKYVSARFVLGHRFVTPHEPELSPRVARFFAGELPPEEARALLDELDVELIYSGAPEQRLATPSKPFDPQTIPAIAQRFADGDTRVYGRRTGK